MFDEHGNRIGGARMTAVVTLNPGEKVRLYRLPTSSDYAAVYKAQARVQDILDAWGHSGEQNLCPIPDEATPVGGGSGAGRAFSVQRYGMLQWGDLFTARQKVALAKHARLISGNDQILGFSLGKTARHCNVLSKWHRGSETVAGAFGMGTLPMSWDFPEMYPLVSYAGGIENAIEDVAKAIEAISNISSIGNTQPCRCCQSSTSRPDS